MTEKENTGAGNLADEMKDYKKTILPVNKGRLKLERYLYFIGATQRGYEV